MRSGQLGTAVRSVAERATSRRRLLGGSLALGLAALPVRSLAQSGTPVATPDSSGFPLSITHALGETTIPAPATRIVTANEHEALDSLLAIGLKPVLSSFSGGYDIGLAPWTAEAGGDEVEFLPQNATREPEVEDYAVADPDLILVTWIDEAVYDQLSELAPTLVVKAADSTTWQDIQRMIGQATGLSEAAGAEIAATEAVITEQMERLAPYAGKRTAVAYQFFDEFLINGATAPIGRFLAGAGLDVISPGTTAEGEIDMLSLERFDLVADAEILISPEFIAADVVAQEANPLFQSLPPVQNGNYVPLSRELAQALYLESTLSMRWGIPLLVDAVIESAEGRGKLLDA